MTDLLPNPCHLLDTAWTDLDAPQGYDDIAVDITVEVDPGETAGYYYANTVYFSTSRVDAEGRLHGAAYAGLQTDGYAGPTVGRVGKIARFSAWGGSAGIAEPAGWSYEFEESGSGYTVLVPYPWREGITYRVRIGRDEEQRDDRIWSASVTDLETGANRRIGRLVVPKATGTIRRPITFHERYLGASQRIEDVEPSRVRFEHVSADDGAVRSRAWRHTRVFSVAAHAELFWHDELPAGVRSSVGIARSAGG